MTFIPKILIISLIVIDGDGKLKKKMVTNKDNKDVINLKAFFS